MNQSQPATISQLSETEIDAAISALISWFKSQDILPPDATGIMVKLQAQLLVDKTRDIDALSASIKNFSHLLTCEIAQALKCP